MMQKVMNVLGVVLARAGSKGLPGKCMRDLAGQPVIGHTFGHALASERLSAIVFTSDSGPAKTLAGEFGIAVIDRPADLASDTATVDDAVRHAVSAWEEKHGKRVEAVALLYGNIPVRADGLIDRAIEHLEATGADSVRSVAPVTKQHPDWVHRLEGDRMAQFRPNSIYRRQDLDPLYYHDGAIAVVTRDALFAALDRPDDHQAFLGDDRRAIVQQPEDTVDIDGPIDLAVAEGILRSQEVSGMNESVMIGERAVGAGQRTFVVAEAGVNHNGELDAALRMVDVAADAGADAVKFQMFRASDLATCEADSAEYQKESGGAASQRDLLSNLELDDAAFAQIRARCAQRGIMFLATPFGPADVQRLVATGVPAIKVASTDLVNVLLLDAVVATGLPLILSTGASTEQEIDSARRYLAKSGAMDRMIFLHCVSSYPAPIASLNLGAIASMRRTLGIPIGLSDHTTWIHAGAIAVAAGACVVEKHFTLSRNAMGPDHAMSLIPSELAEYVEQIRLADRAMGDGSFGLQPIEQEVREIARKSVVAATHIPAGTTIDASMLTLKRPGTGVAPTALADMIGKRAATDIPSDTLVSWNMVR